MGLCACEAPYPRREPSYVVRPFLELAHHRTLLLLLETAAVLADAAARLADELGGADAFNLRQQRHELVDL